MNAAPGPAISEGKKTGASWWVWSALAALVSFVAITRQSLWIDEALTAAKAAPADVAGWWQAMFADRGSDLQMPLYMIYVWGFVKLFGLSEWTLRLANAPWFVAGATVFIKAMPGRRKSMLAMVILGSPFAWYYLDEARPYAMQIGASLMVFAALVRLSENENVSVAQERGWVAAFFCGIVLLSGSSLLGMIWAGGACLSVLVIFSIGRLKNLGWSHLLTCGLAIVTLTAISVYYLWTLKVGARASDVGKTDARNVVFVIYELLGFDGLGPGRLEIRNSGLDAFKPFAIPLALYGLLVGNLLILGARQLRGKLARRKLFGLAMAVGAPIVMILGAGFVLHFRVLGRHFAPLLVVALGILWLGLQVGWSRHHWLSKVFAYGFVILSFVSCLSFRLAARHEKDDYRNAALAANAALRAGQTVWWNAGREGAVFYHVPVTEQPGERNHALWLMNPTPATLTAFPVPDVIITSKPDVYDGRGAFAEYLQQGRYLKVQTLAAFTVWRRPDAMAEAAALRVAGEFD